MIVGFILDLCYYYVLMYQIMLKKTGHGKAYTKWNQNPSQKLLWLCQLAISRL